MIKGIKENTKRTLKTAMAPWAEECSVPLDEVQCKLHLQCLNGRQANVLLHDYKGLFEGMGNWGEEDESEEMEIQRICDALSNGNLQGPKKRILILGGYGAGKSTLSKKIAYDWAVDRFKSFAVVLYIDMRFWVPGDDLGKLVTNQIRSEHVGVTVEMVSSILEKLGDEILLVFDGFHHQYAQFPVFPSHCNILLTMTAPGRDQQTFSTCCRTVNPRNITFPLRQFPDSVLKGSVRSPFPYINTSPMVTMFVYTLIKHDRINPHKIRKFSLCEIFSHLTRYLLTRQEKEPFARSTLMIGKIAFDSLLEDKHCVKQENDVEQTQSPFLVLGRDSLYTFPHIALQLFLGALYFVLELASGESVNALIARNCDRRTDPVMLVDVFWYFCLELLEKQQFSSFLTRKRRYVAYNKLGKYCVKKVNLAGVDSVDLSAAYSGLYGLVKVKYSKAQTFLNQILSKCHKTEMLYLRPNDPLDLILKNIYPNLRWIYLSNGDTSLDTDVLDLSHTTSDDLKIVLINQEEMHILKFVEYANRMNKKHSFYFFGKDKSEKTLDICQFLSPNIQKLFLSQDSYYCDVLVGSEIPKCSSLTHLTIKAEYFRFPGETVTAISDAIAEGKLPRINHVYLDSGANQDLHGVILKSSLSSLTHLDIKQELHGNNLLTLIEDVLPRLESISIGSSGIGQRDQVLLRNQLTNLLFLTLHGRGNNMFLQGLNNGKIPNLRALILLENDMDIAQILTSEKLPNLISLGILRYCGHAIENLLTRDFIAQLNKLDLSHCRLGSKLSYLLRRQLPVLTSLTLCQCGLQTPDIQCLSQAYVEGKLPNIKHLDISHNSDHGHRNIFENLFYKNSKWEKITSLNIQSVHCNYGQNFQDIQSLSHRAQLGYFPALQEIKFSMREEILVAKSIPKYWQDIHTMEIDCMNIAPKMDILSYIALCMSTGSFPSLKVVRLCNWHSSWPTDKLSLRSRGVLVHFITRKIPQEVQPILPLLRYLTYPGHHSSNFPIDSMNMPTF